LRVHGDLAGSRETMRKKPMKVGRVRSTDDLDDEPIERAPRRPTELLLPSKVDHHDPLITPKVEPTSLGSGTSDSDLLVTPKVEAPPPLISPKTEGLPAYLTIRQESSDVLEVDVKEALRASICQKTKIFKPIGSVTTPTSDEENFISSIKVNVISDKNGLSSPSTEEGGDFESALSKSGMKLEEDEETLTMRRERNRLAAQRCRQRRRDRIDKLEKICGRLEHDGSKLELEITDLERELSSLRKLLQTHNCVARRKGVSLPPVLPREGRT